MVRTASKGLEERHQKILNFLEECERENRYSVSIREIGIKTGISSTSVVNYYLDQLEKRGLIERDRKLSRGVRISRKTYPDVSLPYSKYLEYKIFPKVFISYAREDLAFAEQIYLFLKKNNIAPWLDKIDLLPGQDWEMEIQREIEASDYVIICLSRHSVTKRGYVQKEIHKALDVLERCPDGAIYVIPLRLDECDVPTRLLAKQWLDWTDPNAQKKLLNVFDNPNISSRFTKKLRLSNYKEPQDYVMHSLEKDKTIDEIILNLIFGYDLRPSKAEKIYNDCYRKSLDQAN